MRGWQVSRGTRKKEKRKKRGEEKKKKEKKERNRGKLREIPRESKATKPTT